MATQQTAEQSVTVGTFLDDNWGAYKTPQQHADVLVPLLRVSVETGQTGAQGNEGDKGSDAAAKTYEMKLLVSVAIPLAATSVTVPGVVLAGKTLQITALVAQATTAIENFSVGIIQGNEVFFVFNDEANKDVSRDGFTLEVYGLEEVV